MVEEMHRKDATTIKISGDSTFTSGSGHFPQPPPQPGMTEYGNSGSVGMADGWFVGHNNFPMNILFGLYKHYKMFHPKSLKP